MSVKDSLYKFVTTEVKDESEGKDTAVLLRILALFFSVFYLAVSLIMALLGNSRLSLVLVFGIGFLIAGLICTYENKTLTGLIFIVAVTDVLSSTLTFTAGHEVHFEWLLTVTILLVFYNLRVPRPVRFAYSAILIIWSIIVSAIVADIQIHAVFPTGVRLLLSTLNSVTIIGSVTVCAHSYRNKFRDSENKLLQYNKRLIQIATTDALTGLTNRRSMMEHLQELAFIHDHNGRGFSVAIGDVDHFKKINDNYGHDTGDYVLTTLSTILTEFMDGRGTVARWGGEEFLFSFEAKNFELSCMDLDKMRTQIAEYPFHHKNFDIRLSMTFGIEEFDSHTGVAGTISKADTKLYRGKESGRNMVVH